MLRSFITFAALALLTSHADAGPVGRFFFGARSSGCAGEEQAGCSGTQVKATGCSGTVTTVTTTTYRSAPMSHSVPAKAAKKRSNDIAPCASSEPPAMTAVVVETRRPGFFGRLFGRRVEVVVGVQR